MNEYDIIAFVVIGLSIGALIAFRISRREIKNLDVYDEDGIPRILDLSDPYIRLAYVAIGLAGPKIWEPHEVRRIAYKIAGVIREEDLNLQVRVTVPPSDELEIGVCPDCGSPVVDDTKLIAGESVEIKKCPVESCGWEGWDTETEEETQPEGGE